MFKNHIEEIDIGEFKVLFADIPADVKPQVSRLASPDLGGVHEEYDERGEGYVILECWTRVDPEDEPEVWKQAVAHASALREKT
jgi:hypothetical protein